MPLQKKRYMPNNSKEQVLENLIVAQVVKKFPVFHETCYL